MGPAVRSDNERAPSTAPRTVRFGLRLRLRAKPAGTGSYLAAALVSSEIMRLCRAADQPVQIGRLGVLYH